MNFVINVYPCLFVRHLLDLAGDLRYLALGALADGQFTDQSDAKLFTQIRPIGQIKLATYTWI